MTIGREVDFGETPLWTRVNSLDSPWGLDDITTLVAGIGDRLSVMMVPKVEGPWDIHYVDRLLAQLEAKHQVKKPILVHAILETALGVANVLVRNDPNPKNPDAPRCGERQYKTERPRTGTMSTRRSKDAAKVSYQHCFNGDPCADVAGCTGFDGWHSIGEVRLPGSFFLP